MQAYSAVDYLSGVPFPPSLKFRFSTVELEDIGLVGGAEVESSSEDDETEERADLGLPTAFGSSKRGFQTAKGSRKKPRTAKGEAAAKLRLKLGRNLFKYWLQRYSLFSKFDDGIEVDREGWYSITPEVVAQHHATKCPGSAPLLILDTCCGVGGNTIQFAQRGHCVIAVDSNPTRLQMARHNAEIYDVATRIEFLIGDAFELGTGLQPDVLFASPPWGGPDYSYEDYVGLECDTELGMFVQKTLKLAQSWKANGVWVMLFLPRNLNLCAFVRLDRYGFEIEDVEVATVNGVVKGVTVRLHS